MKRTSNPASGRFVLRIDPRLHRDLRGRAREAGVSLNDHCARMLSLPEGDLVARGELGEVSSRAAAIFGSDLIGLAVFGSWARGNTADGSDVDLLVALERTRRIDRSVYRTWDEETLRLAGREVEPHFLHLPEPENPVGGMWAEIAVDGIVVFDRDLRLSRCLVRIRRFVASGRMVRQTVHGQPYWVHEGG